MATTAERRRAAAKLEPGHPVYSGWANARNDSGDYAKLASLLGPRLRPVTPDGRKALRVEGQIPLWAGAPRVGPGLEVEEEAISS